MADPFATTVDLENHLRRALTSAEVPWAETALRYASTLVRALAPWVDNMDPLPDIADVVAAMAARRFSARTDGLKAAGPFVYAEGSPDTFTADEWLVLGRLLSVSGGSMTVSLAGPVAP